MHRPSRGLLISQGKRELGQGDEAGSLSATESSPFQPFMLISGNEIEKLEPSLSPFFVSFCKFKDSPLLTPTALSACLGTGSGRDGADSLVLHVISLSSLIQFQKWEQVHAFCFLWPQVCVCVCVPYNLARGISKENQYLFQM